jgi:VWFA-related protein
MSESTGGEFFRTPAEGDLDFVFERIRDELRKQYAISYRPQFASPDGLFHSVTVVARKGMRVHCRKGYYATSTATLSHQ